VIRSELDTSGWAEGLAKLDGPLRASLARSMAVAGGKVLRDEAKQQAPVESGRLQSSIYLVFKDGESSDRQVIYSVSWNHRVAPHGHLVEFGHWQPYVVKRLPSGEWITTSIKRATPKWIAAKPFLRPAFDIAHKTAQAAMVARGRQRLPELLAGANDEP
jgi:hypothetical protein